MPFPNKMTKLVFSTIPDSDKKDPNRNYQIRYKIKKKNHFDGEVFVLKDGAIFSMGSLVATKLKYSRDATIIGIETGGTAEGSNAVLTGQLILPNSGIRVVVPQHHFDHKVDGQNNGRGLLPDIRVDYSISERIMNMDKEMMEIQKNILSNEKN
ncbi:MAG: S41 family peptidase [Crocinitomicaceae bacterium]|nr:S41 family peptidase [Crocinitomicaceae bacterium]